MIWLALGVAVAYAATVIFGALAAIIGWVMIWADNRKEGDE